MDMVYGGHSSGELMVGLNHLIGLHHPKGFYGSVTPYFEKRLKKTKNKSLWRSITETYSICNIHFD